MNPTDPILYLSCTLIIRLMSLGNNSFFIFGKIFIPLIGVIFLEGLIELIDYEFLNLLLIYCTGGSDSFFYFMCLKPLEFIQPSAYN